MKRLILVVVGTIFFAACAGGPPTTREKATLGGAALGAGTGAIIGSATGKAGTGALIGAGIGALTGAILGDTIQGAQGEQGQAQAVPPPPPQSQAPVQQAAVQVPGQYSADPTQGVLVNATRWRVDVYIDPRDPGNPKSAQTQYTMNPQEQVGAALRVGQHRVIAEAYVNTQFGQELVGKYDKTLYIDPRGSGWSIRFSDGDFR